MKILKIEALNDLKKLHEAFNFFKASFFNTIQTETIAFLPLSDIYDAMVENLKNKRKLQFYATYENQVIGCVIAQPIKGEKGALFMPILAISQDYRGGGIASKLLEHLEEQASKQGYFRIKMNSTQTSLNFIKKNKFKPYLYLEVGAPYTLEDVTNAVNDDYILIEKSVGKTIKTKYLVPFNFDEKDLAPLKKKFKNLNYKILFEKRF